MCKITTLITQVLDLIKIDCLLSSRGFNLLYIGKRLRYFRSFFFADAFDTEQLLECMGQLKSGLSVNIPIYDFKNHRRCSESFRKVVMSLLTFGVKKIIPVYLLLLHLLSMINYWLITLYAKVLCRLMASGVPFFTFCSRNLVPKY